MTREDAIAVLTMQKSMVTSGQACCKALDMAIEALSEPINCVKCEHYYETEEDGGVAGNCKVDTAHLSERTGEWKTDNVYAGIGFYRCDQCNFRQSEKSRYCPNCGADMRGKNNET